MRRSSQLVLAQAIVAALLPIGLGACGADGKPGEVQGVPQYFVMPEVSKDITKPGLQPAINDPGPSQAVNPSECAPAGVEIVVVDDYEGGIASKTYTYNDSTSEVYPLSLKDWEPASTTIPKSWPTGSCGPGSDAMHQQALHLAGVFKDFGAGLGTVLFNHEAIINPDPAHPRIPFSKLSPDVATDLKSFVVEKPARRILFWDGTTPNAAGMVNGPDQPDKPYIVGMKSIDLSAWDGITFWARRGPFAGPGFRPGILDRTTADDFNKQLPAANAECRSIYTQCGCQNLRPCKHWNPATDPMPTPEEMAASIEPLIPTSLNIPLEGDYCWDPKLDKYPPWDPTLRCGDFACDYHEDTPIPAMTYNPVSQEASELWHRNVGGKGVGIGTMTCSKEPYVFKDSTTPPARYCYRPGVDLDPAEKVDRCGDGFLSGVLLDTNWKRYMIPFADLRQGNVDKRSKGIDTGMVEALIFAFPGGNLDVWIDDPGFYRKSK